MAKDKYELMLPPPMSAEENVRYWKGQAERFCRIANDLEHNISAQHEEGNVLSGKFHTVETNAAKQGQHLAAAEQRVRELMHSERECVKQLTMAHKALAQEKLTGEGWHDRYMQAESERLESTVALHNLINYLSNN